MFAATVARLLNDPSRAISLTRAAPAGEATTAEATNLKVRAAAAIMQADNGRLEEGRVLLTEGGLSRSDASHLRALIADAEGDPEAAVRYFEEALAATEDYEEKGRFAFRLARHGVVHAFVEEQRGLGNEKFASHLTLVAEAYGGTEGGIERLQAAAHTSASLSLVLSELYESRGDAVKQLRTLEAAATRLNDADIWLATAQLRREQGHTEAAIQSAQDALRTSPATWGAFARAHGLLVELFSSRRDWDQATKSAENLVRVLGDDVNAIWTLITCQYHAGEFEDALRTWDTMAARQRPTRRQHLLVWLGLFQQFGQSIGTVEDLITVADDWADDEEIRRAVVGLILIPNAAVRSHHDSSAGAGDSEPSAVNSPRRDLGAVISDYIRDFPDGGLRQLTVNLNDGGSILEQIASFVGARPDTTDFDEKVFAGAFPLGTICYAHGGTLAEAVISHASGVRYVSRGGADEEQVAMQAIGSPAVIDTTSLFTLSILPDVLRGALMGSFAALAISSDQFRDAVGGMQSVNRFGHASPALGRYRGSVALRSRMNNEALRN